ncbi:MAG: hypothetical protein H0W86_00550 [Armatimonadetes bacterium]|nr:hypothetical protein [Armatimonadota bacterium]
MKKLIAILMTIAMVGVFAAGCNKKDETTDTPADSTTPADNKAPAGG